MLNVLSKTKTPTISDLELNVVDAAQAVAKARQAHRDARQAHADAVATLAELPNSDALSDATSHALDEMSERGDALGKAMERLAEAERLLTAAREAPVRKELAAQLRDQSAVADLLGGLGPLAIELRKLMLSINFSVADSLPMGGDHQFRRLFALVDEFSAHLQSGSLQALAGHLRDYAGKMEDGFVSKDLGPTFQQLVGHRLAS